MSWNLRAEVRNILDEAASRKSHVRSHGLAAAVAALLLVAALPARAALIGIQGTMSNFDVFNETGVNVYGAELELDGVTTAEVTKTYPCHFATMTPTDYAGGARLTFTGYNFGGSSSLVPSSSPHNTNGHYAVNLPGCEHFGFVINSPPPYTAVTQPTASRFWWLDQFGNKINSAPLGVPLPTWSYNPPGFPGQVQAVLPPPPAPPQAPPPVPDAVWVCVYTTEVPRAVDLDELISGDNSGAPTVAPQEPAEIESEWVLLGADVSLALEAPPVNQEGDVSIVRRYEFFKYTGLYDAEVHLPTSSYDPLTMVDPSVVHELGDFIGANMSAAVLIPEPASSVLLLAGASLSALAVRRQRSRAGC